MRNTPLYYSWKLDVEKLAGLIEESLFVITNDSFPMHLSIALNKELIALFGPTNPKALIPPEYEKVYIHRTKIECSPCYSNSLFPGCNRNDCMESITTEEVKESCIEILER